MVKPDKLAIHSDNEDIIASLVEFIERLTGKKVWYRYEPDEYGYFAMYLGRIPTVNEIVNDLAVIGRDDKFVRDLAESWLNVKPVQCIITKSQPSKKQVIPINELNSVREELRIVKEYIRKTKSVKELQDYLAKLNVLKNTLEYRYDIAILENEFDEIHKLVSKKLE